MGDTTMMNMAQRLLKLTAASAPWLIAAFGFIAATSVQAETYSYQYPLPSYQTPSYQYPIGQNGGNSGYSSGRTYNYAVGYRSGMGGYGFAGGYGGRDSSTGYTGADTSINTPHRSDWYAKLQAQRQWDDMQYRKQQHANGARCGFTGAPDYCYRLMGPYPQELRVVRY